jgi:chitin disaccharide deacetylase
MAPDVPTRDLIVTADDFGRSSDINQAVILAHRRGILTGASLMVNGRAAEEAVRLAHKHPTLAVGLHLTLVDGKSVLPHRNIPDLVDPFDNFSNSPIAAGFRYWADRQLHDQLLAEMTAQIDRFRSFELPLDHLNGHLNIHLHPTVLRLLVTHANTWGVDRVRLTRDPSAIDRQIGTNPWPYRLAHAAIFRILTAHAIPKLRAHDIGFTDQVFGLLQSGRIDESYTQSLLARLPTGISELYCHPDSGAHHHELDALISPAVSQAIHSEDIQLTTYREADGLARTQAPATMSTAAHPIPTYGKVNRNPAGRPRVRGDRRRVPKQGSQAARRSGPVKPG